MTLTSQEGLCSMELASYLVSENYNETAEVAERKGNK
jgi:hypothetical protein